MATDASPFIRLTKSTAKQFVQVPRVQRRTITASNNFQVGDPVTYRAPGVTDFSSIAAELKVGAANKPKNPLEYAKLSPD